MMDLQSAELLAATSEVVELTSWQKIMRVAFSPDALREIAMYVLLMVLLCAISKVVYDIKENRRLKKEFAAYQQRRIDEEMEN
ncbi:MAG: hypothetical protein IJA83_07130 [Clostridia bacterium]|nr:hypothetical protein [Clostridia bacterium]